MWLAVRLEKGGCCMSVVEEAKTLLRMAYMDFRALTGMGDTEVFADEIFGFHAQQAIEKALKAWLCFLAEQYPLTHDLHRLLKLIENRSCEVERYYPMTQYSIFAVQARYEEGLLSTEEPLDRPQVIAEVQDLLVHIEKIINTTQSND